MLKFFMLGLACTGAVIYAGLFADYGYVSSRTSSVPTRGSIIPFLVDSGAFGGSIFMAASSLVVVFSVALFIAATRGIFILLDYWMPVESGAEDG